MHICIDARLYGPLGKGLGRYIERLIENLEIIDTENRYTVLLSRENFHLFTPRSDRWKKMCVPVRWYTLKEQVVIPWVLWRLKPDLVHFPHFNVPFLYRRPLVVTIHDLILLKHPSTRASTLRASFYWFKYLGYRLILRHALRNAGQIITVSKTVRDEITNLFNVQCSMINVTYEASDGVEIGQLKMPDANWLATRGITKPYLLYVGNAYPHKNLDFLLTWFVGDFKSQISNYQLVLVGTEDYFYRQLKKRISQYPNISVSNSVLLFGYATESELADLYRHATLVVYPSLEEGFGLPPLEAMRYDVPVVVSDLPVLREILGDAATYFDPRSKSSLTNAIFPLLLGEGEGEVQSLRSKKIRLGRLQVSKYSWRRMAEQTLEIYRNAMNTQITNNKFQTNHKSQ